MRTRSSTEDQKSTATKQRPAVPANGAPKASPETLLRRAEAAEAKARDLETENKRLRSERAKAVLAAAQAEKALNDGRPTSGDEGERRLGTEADAAVRILEESLREEFSRQVGEMRRSHAAELAARSRNAKKRSAEDLISAVATANEAWKKETEARLRNARAEALTALTRARAAGRLRRRAALVRAALIWRARERKRLTEAKRRWEIMHRTAMDACNLRWQARLDRLRSRLRRRRVRLRRLWIGKERIFPLARTHAERDGFAIVGSLPGQPAVGHAGFVALILILAAVHYSPPRPPVSLDPDPIAAAAARTKQGAADRARTPAPVPPAKPALASVESRPGEQLTDGELRLRLQERIHRLRVELSAR